MTSTLIVAGEPGNFTPTDGRRGAMLRADDKASGRELDAVHMPAGQTGTPMTYMMDGKQYIIIAIGGRAIPASSLPSSCPVEHVFNIR